ncbi:MAG: type I-D CRISPR-associated protein Cas10d/Csc3 [Anaerolineae bacterium]|nr:type I-D CRISPR-associated protein Cas10d/Csc3 [Anaerolineae bacterium]
MLNNQDAFDDEAELDNPASLDEIDAIEDGNESGVSTSPLVRNPIFQTLFAEAIRENAAQDSVLRDFATHVVGPLSIEFAMVSAKGGAFFRMKEAEQAQNTDRYQRDQTLRAHLLNGMLPAYRVAGLLHQWGSHRLRHWDETVKRLFIAGYMLHDYTKIPSVKEQLTAKGFKENDAPTVAKIHDIEEVFIDWCGRLGIDAFLLPVGGTTQLVQELIYIALNTQQLWGTLRIPDALPDIRTDSSLYMLATEMSHLADLLAYVARTPRDMVAHETIRKMIADLGASRAMDGKAVGRLTYHHVAENRGILLNFIHNATSQALTTGESEGKRIPLLYAPSGVVYLERSDAPPIPDVGELAEEIVTHIRQYAGERIGETGKGAKFGNVSIQVDDSYNDFFDLREFMLVSPRLVSKYVKNNKLERLTPIQQGGWPGSDNMPNASKVPKDARATQLAEWAALMETQITDRKVEFEITGWLLTQLGVGDLQETFEALHTFPEARKGGVRYWWYWAAAHAVDRRNGLSDTDTLDWIGKMATDLAAALPDPLPLTAQMNQTTWLDLSDYIARMLTLGGAKVASVGNRLDLNKYTRSKAKTGRFGNVCAICGDDYITRKPAETAVSFQPGVYTARLRIGSSDNARHLCSICALEQLLRQLFVTNLDTGSAVEGQRVRYLAFYPTYFFTPETLRLMKRLYMRLKDIRISDKVLRRLLTEQALKPNGYRDPAFWQRLEPFLLSAPDESASKRILRYSEDIDATFFMVGLRNFNDPSDSESWVLPALLSLVLSICMDIKVVTTESSVPLMLEANELPETVWLEGAHPAITALVGRTQLNIDDIRPALERLTAAYLIHLDTEYEPPKENWHRLPPIAHALMESPLYVFHYLKKQERDGKMMGAEQDRRYITFAEDIFKQQGDQLMSYAQKLVEQYRGFYRAKGISNSNSILRPLNVISDALLVADSRLFPDAESLTEVAYGELYRFMDRVRKGQADGGFPKGVSPQEREQAMHEFCKTFVNDVFIGLFHRDVSALRGKQLNLLKSACEPLYRDAQRAEWAARGQDADEVDDDAEPEPTN